MPDISGDHKVAEAVEHLVEQLVMPYVSECCLEDVHMNYNPSTFGAFGPEEACDFSEATAEIERI